MKRLVVFLGVGLFGLQCTKTENITALTLPCDCKNLPMIYEYKGLEGIIIFPHKPSEPYRIIVPKFIVGEGTPANAICTDSISLSLIKAKKIVDSTTVMFDGGVINYNTESNSEVACGQYAATRITNLIKVR